MESLSKLNHYKYTDNLTNSFAMAAVHEALNDASFIILYRLTTIKSRLAIKYSIIIIKRDASLELWILILVNYKIYYLMHITKYDI